MQELSLLESSPEYVDGRKKLSLTHEYSSGAILKCSENPEGYAKIILTSPKKIIDFEEYSRDYKFVTPTFWLLNKYTKGFGEFEVSHNQQVVSLGEFKSARDLLSLLHEIGHLNDFSFTIEGGPDVIAGAKRNSPVERKAWAHALNLCRKIEQDTGTDVLEPFKDLDEIKRYIYASLLTHRLSAEGVWEMTHPEEILGQDIINGLRRYFDKGKFNKK